MTQTIMIMCLFQESESLALPPGTSCLVRVRAIRDQITAQREKMNSSASSSTRSTPPGVSRKILEINHMAATVYTVNILDL